MASDPSAFEIRPSTPNHAARLEPAGLATCAIPEHITLAQLHQVIRSALAASLDGR